MKRFEIALGAAIDACPDRRPDLDLEETVAAVRARSPIGGTA